MKVVAIIQARMGSSRLPGKVLLPLPNQKTVLAEVIERVKEIRGLDEVVVAIPKTEIDSVLMPHIQRAGATVFRGPETDVLARIARAAAHVSATTVMRITADCPLLNPQICELVLQRYLTKDLDYCCNVMPRTFPAGLDCEVFSAEVLRLAHEYALAPHYREHVTLWMTESWYRPKLAVGNVESSNPAYADHNWTLDTLQDYVRICQVMLTDMRKAREAAGKQIQRAQQ